MAQCMTTRTNLYGLDNEGNHYSDGSGTDRLGSSSARHLILRVCTRVTSGEDKLTQSQRGEFREAFEDPLSLEHAL